MKAKWLFITLLMTLLVGAVYSTVLGAPARDLYLPAIQNAANTPTVRQLTDGSLPCTYQENPEWSPDGTKIAFLCLTDQLFVMNADGTAPTQIFDGGSSISVGPPVGSWSPDSSHIAFQTEDKTDTNDQEIFVIKPDASGLTNLTNTSSDVQDTSPAWSPDGSKIAFVRSSSLKGLRSDIYVMNADGTGQTNLTNTAEVWEEQPVWSPDGSKIAFIRTESACGLFVMNMDGSNEIALTDEWFCAHYPAWSPDGSKIAFSHEVDIQDELFVVNPDGSHLNQLTFSTENREDDYLPQWSPNSQKIFFRHTTPLDNMRFQIHVINVDGSNHINLTPHTESDFDFDLSHDGKKIVFTSNGYDRVGDTNDAEIYVMDLAEVQ